MSVKIQNHCMLTRLSVQVNSLRLVRILPLWKRTMRRWVLRVPRAKERRKERRATRCCN